MGKILGRVERLHQQRPPPPAAYRDARDRWVERTRRLSQLGPDAGAWGNEDSVSKHEEGGLQRGGRRFDPGRAKRTVPVVEYFGWC